MARDWAVNKHRSPEPGLKGGHFKALSIRQCFIDWTHRDYRLYQFCLCFLWFGLRCKHSQRPIIIVGRQFPPLVTTRRLLLAHSPQSPLWTGLKVNPTCISAGSVLFPFPWGCPSSVGGVNCLVHQYVVRTIWFTAFYSFYYHRVVAEYVVPGLHVG